ncbi:MAG: bifunctional 3-hydroxydecanoyl-ACP dehydratase/trans-2-decenoyl-ACP isomerase [Desulfobacterales bacterium]|jgi:3-hydroxyacyl-[acyl-carrier protein] dehydratase/trans-2-decenoyl-[acyl-carrier protein] isomerase|nr:bifunctional 3-hydroxydecanoyl-ACP dehydratase/trans-2-decenoyl-ACP isomerase [Desulfobacterales bacterium]
MKYSQFLEHDHFDTEQLLAFSYGRLIEDPPDDFDARLPAPPFLMIDRILSIEKKGNSGKVIAEQDIRLDAWYFQCHFQGDPVQPGCLCVDAIWQLMGFYCVWCGALGAGRALGCEEVIFNGQIRPHNKVARFDIDIIRYRSLKQAGSSVVIADANVFIDGENITTVKKARTGIFKGITYKDYPNRSLNSLGGMSKG